MCLRLQVEASGKQHNVPCCAFSLCLTSIRVLTVFQLHLQATYISSHLNCKHLNFCFVPNTKIWVYAFKCHSRQCDSTRGPHRLLHVSRLRILKQYHRAKHGGSQTRHLHDLTLRMKLENCSLQAPWPANPAHFHRTLNSNAGPTVLSL